MAFRTAWRCLSFAVLQAVATVADALAPLKAWARKYHALERLYYWRKQHPSKQQHPFEPITFQVMVQTALLKRELAAHQEPPSFQQLLTTFAFMQVLGARALTLEPVQDAIVFLQDVAEDDGAPCPQRQQAQELWQQLFAAPRIAKPRLFEMSFHAFLTRRAMLEVYGQVYPRLCEILRNRWRNPK